MCQKRLAIVVILFWILFENTRAVTTIVPKPVYAAVILVVFITAIVSRSWVMSHLGLLVALIFVISPELSFYFLKDSGLGITFWFLLTVLVFMPFASSRKALTWLRLGNIDRLSWRLMGITSFVAGLGLILWAQWTDNLGAGVEMIKSVSQYPPWFIALVSIPVFALSNAFCEEILYRGVVQEALIKVLGEKPFFVIPLQSSVFSAIHFAVGFPNGVIGYLMVFVWGSVLGYLRHRTSGMLSPYLVHVAADVVIASYLFFVSR